MKTNFFEYINTLNIIADLKIVVSFGKPGNLVVSVMLTNDGLSDKAGKLVQPMIIRGTVAELDEHFFETITAPVQETARLFANMDEYQKGLDAAKLASKQQLDKKNKNTRVKATAEPESDEDDKDDDADDLFTNKEAEEQQKADRKKAYEEAMKQVAELNGQMKYDEALALLPSETDHPEKKEEISRKRSELNKRRETLAALKLDL